MQQTGEALCVGYLLDWDYLDTLCLHHQDNRPCLGNDIFEL